MFKTTLIALATFATLALGAPPSETVAAEASLAGNVLRKTVSGKTVYLDFRLRAADPLFGRRQHDGEHEHRCSRLGAGRRRL
jgi:hypothetical protein